MYSDDLNTDTDIDSGHPEASILDIDTSDAVEPSAVEAGEYEIRITGQRKDQDGNVVRTSGSGNEYFIITFDIPSEEASKGFSKVFSTPSPEMEPKRRNATKWAIEEFKRCFGLTTLTIFKNKDATCWDAMIGAKGYVLLSRVETEKYGAQNEIKKFLVPSI